ncbi:MAG: transglycosylase domain-containing protein [Gemmatimonadales bacterium]
MTRQAIALRLREAAAAVRGRLTWKRVAGAVVLVSVLGLVAVTAEAMMRARLGTAEERRPSALYTRPEPWDGGNRRGTAPLPLGTLNGSALEHRIPVALDDLPEHLIGAVLAVEDQRFFGHHGLDVRRIGGALIANVRAGAIRQGGSTITQQLSKNLFLSARRTPLRKLREMAHALVIEARYAKDAILEAYLNEIYLGQDGAGAIHGVGAAARFYFGKDARRLGVAEAALIAGMISAPNRYSPIRNPSLARQRRELVLDLMVAQQRLSAAAADRARRASLPSRARPTRTVEGRWFRDFVQATPNVRLPGRARGVAVYTTLDATLQLAAERAVRAGLQSLRAPQAEAALVALDPRNGEILAMVGGHSYAVSQFNRATEARRQPGSAFKPIVALAALEPLRGRRPAFTLASVVDDEPLRVATPRGPWEPENYDRQFRGRVTLREAIEYSLNVPFARVGLAIGPDRIAETARRLGITSPMRAVPSLALGSSEVTLLELVRAHGALAAGGTLAHTRTILGEARPGKLLEQPDAPLPSRVADPAVAYLVTSALQGAVARGTGRALGDGRFEGLAGKTGTSNDWRDAWFVAYTPSLVVGVWVGFDDGRSLRSSGASAALPIVGRFLDNADGDWEEFEVPDGITEGWVRLADAGWFDGCGEREVFLEGTEPQDGGCFRFELPRWTRDLGEELAEQASRFFKELVGQAPEHHHRRGRR